tara:strand:- start:3365 stop:3904 length:540 start_codon:yes stop_codon:yes gene_type:complete
MPKKKLFIQIIVKQYFMKLKNFKFINFSLIITLFISCNQDIDYKAIINEYESMDPIVCKSLLEIDGKLLYMGSPFSGPCLIYDDNFKTKIKLVTYEQGLENGINIGYYEDGNVDYVGYRVNGEINGEFIKLYKNGETAILGQFKNGLYVGKFKFFNENGELTEIKKYNEFGILKQTRKY